MWWIGVDVNECTPFSFFCPLLASNSNSVNQEPEGTRGSRLVPSPPDFSHAYVETLDGAV